MALWDKLFKNKDEESGRLNPIVQKNPPPVAYRHPPQIQQAPPVGSSVTEHTTRNFDPVPRREQVIHE